MKPKMVKSYCIFLAVVLWTFFLLAGSLGAQNEAKTYYQNGYLFFSQQKFEQAKEAYQKALELDPDFWEARYWLGKTLEQLGDLPGALNEWTKILVSSPSNRDAFQKWVVYAPRVWGRNDVDLTSLLSGQNRLDPEKLWKEFLPRAIVLSRNESLDQLLLAIQTLDWATQQVSNLFAPYLRSAVKRAIQNISDNPQPGDMVTYQLLFHLKEKNLIAQEETEKIFTLLFAHQAGISEEEATTTQTLEISAEGIIPAEESRDETQPGFFINQP